MPILSNSGDLHIGRGWSTAQSFLSSPVVKAVYYFSAYGFVKVGGPRCTEISENECVSKFECDVDLVLLHDNDKDNWGYYLSQGNWIMHPKLIVRYTGGTPREDPPGGDYWIGSRSITATDPLTEMEAKSLVDAYLGCRGDMSRFVMPPALASSRCLDYLPAVSILCQGYLAAHIDPETSESDVKSNEFVEAIQKMGWTDLLKRNGDDIRQLLSEKMFGRNREILCNEVETPAFWDIVRKRSKECGNEWSCLQPAGTKYGLAEIEALLTDVDRNLPIQPDVVARAYLAIHYALAKP